MLPSGLWPQLPDKDLFQYPANMDRDVHAIWYLKHMGS